MPVSTTVSPVTHTAEVAVNKATLRGALVPCAVAAGSNKSRVPIVINVAKPATRVSPARTGAGPPQDRAGRTFPVRS